MKGFLERQSGNIDKFTNDEINTIEILDHGWVTLDSWIKDDYDIVRHARESTTADLKGEEKDIKLLNFLWRNGHVSPFDQPWITFRIQLPIFVMRQFVRHHSLKFNELSGRYSQMPDLFYTPTIWRANTVANKQSSEEFDLAEKQDYVSALYEETMLDLKEVEKDLRNHGIANEMVRLVNPVSQYTRISVSGTLRDWLLGFCRQRLSLHAQYEIREYAYAIGKFLRELYPNTWNAFMEYTMSNLNISVGDEYNNELVEKIRNDVEKIQTNLNLMQFSQSHKSN